MLRFYKDRFANAADFTFFMVGAFKVDEALPLVAKYVGVAAVEGDRLAALPRRRDARSRRRWSARGSRRGASRARRPSVSFAADPPLEENEQTRVEAATEVLEIALRDILREELGETYSVRVGLPQPLPQRGAGRICGQLRRRAGQGARAWSSASCRRSSGCRRKDRRPISSTAPRKRRTASTRPRRSRTAIWLGRLQSAKLLQRDPKLILTREQRIDAITQANVHEMFKKYFPMDRYTVVTLLPEPAGK